MTEHNLKFLGTIILTSLLVGSYQLPLIENTLNKYGFENNINQNFIYAKNFQQFIEDEKISFSSYLTDEKNTTVSFVDRTNNIQLSSNPVSTSIENNNINNSSGINKGNLEANSQVSTSKSTCSDNCVVLMIGDSVMGDVDFSLQRLIKKEFPNWKIIDGHKVSSGLTNQTYYDWPSTAKKLVEKNKPDYVFVLLGTNDAQNMMADGKGLTFSKDLWTNEYSNRVNKMTSIVSDNGSKWFWIGLPVTRDKSFNSRLQVIREIEENQTKEHYISVEQIFGKNDHSEPINMKLRASDGIHLNSSGADLVAKELLLKLKG